MQISSQKPLKYMNKLYLILDFYYKIRYTENGIMLEGRG